MLHQTPQILEREQSAGLPFCFAIGLVVGPADAPRVSVKAAGLGGTVEIVSVEQVPLVGPQTAPQRSMVFEAEAQRRAAPWSVVVVVECGATLLTLAGPLVPGFDA